MEPLYTAIIIAIFCFVLAALYTVFYFRHEIRSLSKHKALRKLHGYSLIPLVLLIIFGVFYLIVYWLRAHVSFDGGDDNTLKFTALGEIGDLFNGLVGPFIALLSVILFYKAYREQIRTNSKNDELRLLEYCHSRLDFLKEETTIKAFESNCEIYINANVSQSRKEMALKRIMSIFSEFDNIKQIVADMELHATYLEDQYLTVMSNDYFEKMQEVNISIVNQGVIGGHMLRIMVGIEGRFNRVYREYYELLEDGGHIEY
jgi:hypothetical protein